MTGATVFDVQFWNQSFTKLCLETRQQHKPILLIVQRDSSTEAWAASLSLLDAVESGNIIKKHFIIAGFDLTSPPVENMAQLVRVEPPVMSAVYFVFVNHENKVQLFKRLDIVPTDEKRVRNKQTLDFLAESKNLFDLMAEEDPAFRQQQIL